MNNDGNLITIFGKSFQPSSEKHIDPPEIQFRDAIVAAGMDAPDHIVLDGKIHRFNSGGKRDKSAWYIAFGDGVPAGKFGDWREGIEIKWRANVGRELSPAEQMAHARRMAEASAAREAELKKSREVVADTVAKIWIDAGAASPDHPYLARKSIHPNGARITGDGRLIVQLYNRDGKLVSLQYISDDGTKRYHPGGPTGGSFWSVGTTDEPGPVYLAEGFATAATIHEATGRCCFIAYSASNLVSVAETIRAMHDDLIIVADNDKSGIGQRYAEQAAAKYGAKVIVPPIEGDANDYARAGHDLSALLNQQKSDWLIQADEFSGKPAPISWLIKHWLQNNALMMMHGPSGSGKTFIVLDMCLHMAAGIDDWMGNRVRPGNIVYLAGEGHHGLRGRIAAWKHHHNINKLTMWLSKAGCDLNTTDGYIQVAEAVSALPSPPDLIVVDTLHRFLNGDENSAKDTKTMLDACSDLMRQFECSVLLVHHTGVSDEAQHRARGSSAWRGALDIEISVVLAKGDGSIQVVQRKNKDSEVAQPIFVDLQAVEIPGWTDEDGEPVTSAVVVAGTEPIKVKSDSPTIKAQKLFERAWFDSGAEDLGGVPYLSRSAFREFLEKNDYTPGTIRNYLKPSYTKGTIGMLLLSGIIEIASHGWSVADKIWASALMVQRTNSRY